MVIFLSSFNLLIVTNILEGGNPPYAIANFDSNLKRVPCLSGTRIDILEKVDQWIESRVESMQPVLSSMILWWLLPYFGSVVWLVVEKPPLHLL
jgi:hypothetical protein